MEASNEYKIVCPFHPDINASLAININEGSFYCFGCNVSGDALKFVILVNKGRLDDLEACIKYYKILKSKKVKSIKVIRSNKIKKEDVDALNIAHDYYFGLSKTNWCEQQDVPITEYMQKRGYKLLTLNACKAKLNYNSLYPIIFPMFDLGEFKGWVCRTNNKRIEKVRKYLYNEGFSRSSTLVGDYDAKVVILVEGYMDWLKIKQYGINNVAAILGWKITEQQVNKLKKQGAEIIISALDNDECGNKGTLYLKKFFKVIRAKFPPGIKDPGELTSKEFRRMENGLNRRFKNAGEKIRLK